MSDTVNHPDHYSRGKLEVITLAERLGFCTGNIVKYILRAPYKGEAKEDIKKAKWYLSRLHRGNIDPTRSFLVPWTEVLEIASAFESPAVDAVLEYCMEASPKTYQYALREINKLEKNIHG